VLVEVRGDVTQGGRALAIGDQIAFEEEIVVRDGRATIELPDGATLRLYPDTRLRLPEKNRVRLFLGKVWALIAKRFEKDFEVETTNAVAGIRGTELIVETSEKRTRVAVVTGEVEVANLTKRAAKKRVTKGQEVIVEAEATPTEPAAFEPEAEKKEWQELGEMLSPKDEEVPTEGPLETPRKRRPKNRLEREGEETKRRLIEEGERTERELERESTETRRELDREEAEVRRKMKEDEKRAKEGGSVKDFLE
jgi:hypothetical protein